MNLLFLNHNVGWSSGTFFRAFGFGRQLACIGHHVTLLTISKSARIGVSRESRDGVDSIHTPDLLWGRGRTGWDPWDVLNRLWYLRGKQWDIVHAWDSRPVVILPALFAAAQSRANGGRLVMDWCDWWGQGGTQAERVESWMQPIAPIETFFEEHFRNRPDGTTVISQALRQRACTLGVDPKRILLLPQGCDVSAPLLDRREPARERLALPVGTRLLVSVGALNKSDASLLFGSVREILARRPDCHFALIGKHGVSVPPDLSTHERFRETGYVPASTLDDYVAAADAALTLLADTTASRARWPSKVNGFLSAGRVTVISRVGDLAAMLEREDAAVVTKPDAADVCHKVLDLLDNNAARERLEREARRVAETVLAWTILTGTLDGFYRTVHDA